MSLYRVTSQRLEAVSTTTFAAEGLLERRDIQRLLREDLTPISADLLIIAEEFGEWEASTRRIDLLCLTKDAGLAVIEIKRTDDGGHMDLQAIRYAAMVSSMTLDQAIAARARTKSCGEDVAMREILDFLQSDSADEVALTGDVRIILVSADFSTELTTSVLWLNQRDLEITCVRLRPYRIGSEIFIDATQIVPLPEAADYEIKVRAQEKEKRKVVGIRQELLKKFFSQLIEKSKATTSLLSNRKPTTDHWLSVGVGRTGISLSTTLTQFESRVECYISVPAGEDASTAIFNALKARRESIETKFGATLEWQDLPGRQGCRICADIHGGWKTPESEWPEIQERLITALIALEASLRKPIAELNA